MNEAEQLAAKVCRRQMLREPRNRHAGESGGQKPAGSCVKTEYKRQMKIRKPAAMKNPAGQHLHRGTERGKTETFVHGLKNQCYARARRRKIVQEEYLAGDFT
jgi:hypothetical protein